MRVLLDTHAAIWAVAEPDRLSAEERTLLADERTEVAVSVASLWEIAIKYALDQRTGRGIIPFGAATAKTHFGEAGFQLLEIAAEHVIEVERLPLLHGDPFDRLIVAQARIEPLRLISHDSRVRAYFG